MKPIVDTHAHLFYDEEGYDFSPDIEDVIRRAIEAGVQHMLLPNLNTETFPKMMRLVDIYPANCLPMIGIHPTYIGQDYLEQLDYLETELRKAPSRFVAIGEIGLDYHWSLEYKAEMHEAFIKQLDWALEFDLPVSVHSRDAEDDTFEILKEYEVKGLRGVVHAFGGTQDQMVKALELRNFMIGITGRVTHSNRVLSRMIEGVLPLERMVIETDAPFLTPEPYRGKRNEPAYLQYVVSFLSKQYGVTEQALRSQLFANSAKMFNLAR